MFFYKKLNNIIIQKYNNTTTNRYQLTAEHYIFCLRAATNIAQFAILEMVLANAMPPIFKGNINIKFSTILMVKHVVATFTGVLVS